MYPCATCRRGHHFGAFFVGEDVIYRINRQMRRSTISPGTRGRVKRWGSMPSATQYVIVEFRRRGSPPIELEFAPCELQSVATQLVGRVMVAV